MKKKRMRMRRKVHEGQEKYKRNTERRNGKGGRLGEAKKKGNRNGKERLVGEEEEERRYLGRREGVLVSGVRRMGR